MHEVQHVNCKAVLPLLLCLIFFREVRPSKHEDNLMLLVLLKDEQILASDDVQEHEGKHQQTLAILSLPKISRFAHFSLPGEKQQIKLIYSCYTEIEA
jgi:hypothetical protein